MIFNPSPLLLGITSVAGFQVLQDNHIIRRDVVGNSFDRFIQIFLENQDYIDCIANPDLQFLATQGILLTNFYAITHPSQPNYIAAVGGSTNGASSNGVYNFDDSVKTVIDLLEDGGVSWGVYQEDMPSTGFTGDWPNQDTGSTDYVRKHNPVISYGSVVDVPSRLDKIRNFTLFHDEIGQDVYPQWSFLTPNMTNDGHDTSLEFGASWARSFLVPLLSNASFNTDRTLIILTYDEGSYSLENQVISILLGGAIPDNLKGTTDETLYSHFSIIKTVEENWGLGSLAKSDADANSFFPRQDSSHGGDPPVENGAPRMLFLAGRGSTGWKCFLGSWVGSVGLLVLVSILA